MTICADSGHKLYHPRAIDHGAPLSVFVRRAHHHIHHMPSLQVALANLDAVLLESRGTFEMLPEHVLAQLEEVQLMQSPRASASPQADGEHSELRCCPAFLCSTWA